MGGFSKTKPVLYLLMGCASLYSATRLIEPILTMKEKGLGPQSVLGMLTGAGANASEVVAGNLPAGANASDLNSLLAKAGLASTGASDPQAAPAEPREIVIRDVRFVDEARANRDLFTRAIALQNMGELDEAAALYHRILDADPEDTGVHRNLAVLYCQQQRYADSWKHIHALRQLGRDMPEGFLDILTAAMPDPGAGEDRH